jgi:16S rRNA (cytosine967-C5)-methyltransferase
MKIEDLLARVLYEVLQHKVSIDVAFKRACRGKCAKTLEEREKLYELSREFVSDYLGLICIYGRDHSLRKLARLWMSGYEEKLGEIHCRLSYQKWFVDKMIRLLGDEGIKILDAMNRRNWWLRINTLLSSKEKVLRLLEGEGVIYEEDTDIWYMLRIIETPKPIRLLRVVKEYLAIPQDKASVAVVEALGPKPGDLILDMSAAPGMKTSLIMMLTENRATVTAVDISISRSYKMKHLLRRLGVDTSKVLMIVSDSTIMNYKKKFDCVLLDAPCSNSGAIAKDPGIKIHLTESKVGHYSSIQKKLISKAVSLGEIIVYSTCSLMPEEGEDVIAGVMKYISRIERALSWTSYGYPIMPQYRELMRTFPHKHLTDGFFMAKLITE